ncbi:alpha/beta fold hydrolase [Elongatibacter sediminis]|uniref:Alpha/beta hydrolase n=1 Tax=Elongatibacter sediminis TaxID=3119006 RepID=A0AAW9RF16_9GAMM
MSRSIRAVRVAIALAAMLAATLPAIAEQTTADPGYTRAIAADADQLRHARVNGVRLAYRLEGAGTPVIFVHGEGYSHELWGQQLDAFSRDYLFVSYDRRGHGQSEDPLTGYSETAHANDLEGLIRHLGIDDAHFVVNSRGGAIIIRFLKLYPQRVRSITFADATIPLSPITEESAFHGAVTALHGPAPTLEQVIAGRDRAKTSRFTRIAQSRDDVRPVLHRMVDAYSPRVSANPQRSDMASATHIGPWNSRDFPDMATMAQPILLIVAEHGDPFFIAGAQEAHRLWPNTRYHLMGDVDHLLMLEAPEDFNQRVGAFIREVDEQIAGRARWTEVKRGGDYD